MDLSNSGSTSSVDRQNGSTNDSPISSKFDFSSLSFSFWRLLVGERAAGLADNFSVLLNNGTHPGFNFLDEYV